MTTLATTTTNQDFTEPNLRRDNRRFFPLRFHNAVFQDAYAVTSNVFNELRLGFNRTDLARNNSTFATELGFAEISGAFNSDFQSLLAFKTNTYTVADNLSIIRGRQTIKTGFEIRHVDSARFQGTNPTYFYNNLNDLITNPDNPSGGVRVTFGNPGFGLRTTNYGFYVQDDIRFSQRLQLNLGLRYEYYTPLKGAFNIQSSDPFGLIATERDTLMFKKDGNNFAPRLGGVFDVFGNQKLVVRVGGALTYAPPQPFYYYDQSFVDPRIPFDARFLRADVPADFSLAFPFPQSSFAQQIVSNPGGLPRGLLLGRQVSDYNREDEYAGHYNLAVQYAVTPSLAVQAAYTGSRSVNIIAFSEPNQFLPGTFFPRANLNGVRPRTDIGRVVYRENSGRGYYDALQVSVNQRFRRSVTLDFYYTFAKNNTYFAVDGDLNAQNRIQDYNNVAGSYGPKDSDVRHRFTNVHTVELPTPGFASGSGFLSRLFGGYNVQGIVSYRTGFPINLVSNIDNLRNGRTAGARPDLRAGINPYLDDDDNPYTYFNLAAFDFETPFREGRVGNLGFNALRGPDFFSYDASIIKRFRINEGHRIDFRVEAFNVLNRKEFFGGDAGINASPQFNSSNTLTGFTTNGNFGRVLNTSGPRNIQFGLKYVF